MKKVLVVALLLIASMAQGQTDAQRKQHFNIKKNIAIDGYDPVSYFDGKPKEGSSKFAYTTKGVTYWFTSSTNLGKFKAAPEKFEPAYGGWCAYAMGDSGEKVKIDPETFKITDGKLYLFYNFWGNNTLEEWNKNEKELKQKADRNWKRTIE